MRNLHGCTHTNTLDEHNTQTKTIHTHTETNGHSNMLAPKFLHTNYIDIIIHTYILFISIYATEC